MKRFKSIINIINITFGAGLFGLGAAKIFNGDYEFAAYSFFIVSLLYMVGYFVERWSE